MVEQAIKAGTILCEGGVILYPTDTIWGLGCDATNFEAVKKIFQIKERPDKKSMLVLMDGISMLSQYLEKIPEIALQIIAKEKKPTTIIYHGVKGLSENLSGEDGTLGIRITSDPFCLKLLQITGKPIVSTSANISGQNTASTFHEINPAIKQKVDHVVNWRQEESTPSAPSSIIMLDGNDQINVIRP